MSSGSSPLAQRAGTGASIFEITDREQSVLQLLNQNLDAAEIGDRLQISSKTVETHLRNVAEKLGVPTVEELRQALWIFRVARWDDIQADRSIREGLPIEIVTQIQSLLDLTDDEAAHLIGRSRSTYTRYRNSGRDLGPAEAERAVRFAQLLALAAETFGSLPEAKDWMLEENYALGGETPFILAETGPGDRVVRDLLMGLQHGHPV